MLAIYYLVINIIAFSFFFIDKQKAIHHKYRVSENTLFILILLGGVFGSFIAMKLFHHKTKKFSFTLFLIIGLCLHLYILKKIILIV